MRKKRRGNREGTITKRRDGRWEARITVGRGRRIVLYGKTREEASTKLTDAAKARNDGLLVATNRLTLGTYLTTWLTVVKTQVRPRTWNRYEELIRIHVLPELGQVLLAQLGPDHLEGLYAAKLQAGLSPTTVRHLHGVLSAALNRAIRLGRVARNVAQLAEAPRIVRREMTTLTREQVIALLDAATGDRLGALYVLACTLGMRQGELLALRWKHINLETGMLQVAGTLQRTADGLGITEPKTERSRRRLQLTAQAVEALRRHKARQLEERLLAGAAWEDSGLVFCNEIGRPIEAGNLLRRSFWPLLAKVGLARSEIHVQTRVKHGKEVKVETTTLHPMVRFHDLRHTTATLLLEEGVHPAIVAAMLGHARASTTIDIYSHVTPTMTGEASAVMERVLKPKRTGLSSELSSLAAM